MGQRVEKRSSHVPCPCEGKLGNGELVFDRSCLLLADLGREQVADDALRLHLQEPAIVKASLADDDRLDRRLRIVVDDASAGLLNSANAR